jgi:hypothetical protein
MREGEKERCEVEEMWEGMRTQEKKGSCVKG